MKKNYLFFLFLSFILNFGQISEKNILPGRVFKFDFSLLSNSVKGKLSQTGKIRNQIISLPLNNGKFETFTLTENRLTESRLQQAVTFDGENVTKTASLKLTLFNDKFNAIVKTKDGYFMIEPYQTKNGEYRIYNVFENIGEHFSCGTNEKSELMKSLYETRNGLASKSISNFPYGSQLRKFRMAVATTGEFTQAFSGNQDSALAEAVNMLNLINKIYESEVSITFSLIAETTNKTLIFTNASTDPFTVDPSFANANNSQTGFNTMNSNGTLAYSKYDIGHTFNILSSGGARGQAGPQPCQNTSKARAWSEWTLSMPKAIVANLIVHEMGHQFSAWHTYNAVGGSSSSPTFCTSGWSSDSAVEPGAGTTIMSYGNNCTTPNDQTNSGNNGLSYFNIRSLEQITANLASNATCYTVQSSINLPPTASAGVDITIPKNTPFKLKGIATDPDNIGLSYTWEQADIASANDKGAFGSTIAGSGSYTAVNSNASAPLFRSLQSTETTERYFPKIQFVMNNQNNPPVAEAEALSAVARTMKFRFTVRDNNTSNGGVDSDEIVVTVSNNGPLVVSYPNATGISVATSSNVNVTWDVNGTNAEKSTVNVLLSVDGGNTFPYILANNVLNNGSTNVTIPNVPATTKARIKVVGVINNYAEFFDASDNNFTITSTCMAYATYISPTTTVSTTAGSSVANLNMTTPPASGDEYTSKSFVYNLPTTNSNIVTYNDVTMTTPRLAINNYPSYTFKFRVTKTGAYTFTNSTGGFLIISIHSSTPQSTSNFVASNAYYNGSSYTSFVTTQSMNLTEGTDYYLVSSNFSNPANANSYNITISGAGSAYEITTAPVGYSYTFVAIDNSTGKIAAVNTTANFTSLPTGNYTVEGISYDSAVNSSTFIGKSISELIGLSVCLYESKNSRTLTLSPTLAASEVKESDFVLAPNPVEDILRIMSQKTATYFEIIDVSGRIISKNTITDNSINFRGVVKGVYILKLYNQKSLIYQTKIIKK